MERFEFHPIFGVMCNVAIATVVVVVAATADNDDAVAATSAVAVVARHILLLLCFGTQMEWSNAIERA